MPALGPMYTPAASRGEGGAIVSRPRECLSAARFKFKECLAMRNRVKKAFTLIEILIVVVILGILAAIVIPQFTKASDDAQAGNVQTQLSTIRNMIELFRVRNNGAYPFSSSAMTWGDPAGATAAARGLRGPDYLRADPVNPRTNASDIAAGTSHTASTTAGWIWDDTAKSLFACRWNESTKAWE